MLCVICHQHWISATETPTSQLQDVDVSDPSPAALNCGHIFHYTCILKWLALKNCCPTCRKEQDGTIPLKIFLNMSTSQAKTFSETSFANKDPSLATTESLAKLLAEGYSEKIDEKNADIEKLKAKNENLKRESCSVTERFIVINEKRLKLKEVNKELLSENSLLNKRLNNALFDLETQSAINLKLKTSISEMENKIKTLDFYKQSLIEARKMVKTLSSKLSRKSKQASQYQLQSILSSQIPEHAQEYTDTSPVAISINHTSNVGILKNSQNIKLLDLNTKTSSKEDTNLVKDPFRGSLKPSVFKPMKSHSASIGPGIDISNPDPSLKSNPFALFTNSFETKQNAILSKKPPSSNLIELGSSQTNRKRVMYNLPHPNPKTVHKRQSKLEFIAK